LRRPLDLLTNTERPYVSQCTPPCTKVMAFVENAARTQYRGSRGHPGGSKGRPGGSCGAGPHWPNCMPGASRSTGTRCSRRPARGSAIADLCVPA
jgi:hypothetical protein